MDTAAALLRRCMRAGGGVLPLLAVAGVLVALPPRPATPGPLVRQTEATDCGPAALAMLLEGRVALEALKTRMDYRRGGASLWAMIQAGAEHGLALEGYRLELPALERAPLPAIVLMRPDHYLVVDGFDDHGDVLVRDPAQGRRRLVREGFLARWEGVALLRAPEERMP